MLRFLFDDEARNSSEYSRMFTEMQNIVEGKAHTVVTYNSPSHHYKTGYDRQQWLKFNADNFTSSEYVGFVDADTVIITYVDREDLFEDGKPVINGRIGHVGYSEKPHPHKPPTNWPKSTMIFTGLEEPVRLIPSICVLAEYSII